MISRHRIDNVEYQELLDDLNNSIISRDSVAAITDDVTTLVVTTDDVESSAILNVGQTATTVNLGCGAIQVVNVGQTGGVTQINVGAAGDSIQIAGTLAQVNTTVTNVSSNRITLNNGGAVSTNAGILVEEAAVDTAYTKVSTDRTTVMLKSPLGAESTFGNAVTTPLLTVALRDMTAQKITVSGAFTDPRLTATILLTFIRIGTLVNLHIPAVGVSATLTGGQPWFTWNNPAGIPQAVCPRYNNGITYGGRVERPGLMVNAGAPAVARLILIGKNTNFDGTIISGHGPLLIQPRNVVCSGDIGWADPICIEYQIDYPVTAV